MTKINTMVKRMLLLQAKEKAWKQNVPIGSSVDVVMYKEDVEGGWQIEMFETTTTSDPSWWSDRNRMFLCVNVASSTRAYPLDNVIVKAKK